MSTRNRIRVFTIALASLALAASACQKGDDVVVKKLDEISKKLDKLDDIETKLAGGGRPAAARPRGQEQPQAPRPGTPDPAAVYSLDITGAPFAGPKDAKVTIVKAFEFACPFCLRVNPTIAELEKQYGDDLKVVYKNYVVHPQVATTPALAACAAHKQGKYHEMVELIWEKGFNANRNLSAENMEILAKELGLNMSTFKADMNGDSCKQTVQMDQAQLTAVGTRGTPAFYINGRFLSGAQPIDRFKALIDEELAKANGRISKGEASVKDYYAKYVLAAGEKKVAQ